MHKCSMLSNGLRFESLEIIRYFTASSIVSFKLPLVWNKDPLFLNILTSRTSNLNKTENIGQIGNEKYTISAKWKKKQRQKPHPLLFNQTCVLSTLLCIFYQFVVDLTLHSQCLKMGIHAIERDCVAVHLFLIRTGWIKWVEEKKNYFAFYC